MTIKPRKSIPSKVVSLVGSWGASDLYANVSYEVDELRRDIQTCEVGTEKNIRCIFLQDRLVVNPGVLKTKEGKTYSVRVCFSSSGLIYLNPRIFLDQVYSPWQRQWLDKLNENLDWIAEMPAPQPNEANIRQSPKFKILFDSPIPDHVEGFQCEKDDKENMKEFWPAGAEAASKVSRSRLIILCVLFANSCRFKFQDA